jgi:hypothetical protein
MVRRCEKRDGTNCSHGSVGSRRARQSLRGRRRYRCLAQDRRSIVFSMRSAMRRGVRWWRRSARDLSRCRDWQNRSPSASRRSFNICRCWRKAAWFVPRSRGGYAPAALNRPDSRWRSNGSDICVRCGRGGWTGWAIYLLRKRGDDEVELKWTARLRSGRFGRVTRGVRFRRLPGSRLRFPAFGATASTRDRGAARSGFGTGGALSARAATAVLCSPREFRTRWPPGSTDHPRGELRSPLGLPSLR